MADTKAQLTASPAFHHLVARRWRVSLALTACLFVLYYGYILLIAVNNPLLAYRLVGLPPPPRIPVPMPEWPVWKIAGSLYALMTS